MAAGGPPHHPRSLAALAEVARQVGKQLAKMHDAQQIHGDLTTSNIVIREGSLQPVRGPASGLGACFTTASRLPLPGR